jgi:recombination protein RecT
MGNELTPYQQQYANWEDLLERAKPKLADLLPASIPPQRLCRMLLNQMTAGSALLKCTMPSVLGAMLEAAQMGLEIGTGGQCWLIPFKGEAKLVVGYRGFIDLMYRTGQVDLAQAEVVYDNEEFKFTRQWGGGQMPTILHEPCELPLDQRGKLRGAYFVGLVRGSSTPMIRYLSLTEVMERKAHSRARKDSVWVSNPAAMFQKSAVRDGERFMPHDYTFARAVTIDQQADLGTQDLSVDPKDFGIGEEEAAEIVEGEIAEADGA